MRMLCWISFRRLLTKNCNNYCSVSQDPHYTTIQPLLSIRPACPNCTHNSRASSVV